MKLGDIDISKFTFNSVSSVSHMNHLPFQIENEKRDARTIVLTYTYEEKEIDEYLLLLSMCYSRGAFTLDTSYASYLVVIEKCEISKSMNLYHVTINLKIITEVRHINYKIVLQDINTQVETDLSDYTVSIDFTPALDAAAGTISISFYDEGTVRNLLKIGDLLEVYIGKEQYEPLGIFKIDGIEDREDKSGSTFEIIGRIYSASLLADKQFTTLRVFSEWEIPEILIGTSGSQDSKGIYENGILYQTGVGAEYVDTDITETITVSFNANTTVMQAIRDILETAETEYTAYALPLENELYFDQVDSEAGSIEIKENENLIERTIRYEEGIKNWIAAHGVALDTVNESSTWGTLKEDANWTFYPHCLFRMSDNQVYTVVSDSTPKGILFEYKNWKYRKLYADPANTNYRCLYHISDDNFLIGTNNAILHPIETSNNAFAWQLENTDEISFVSGGAARYDETHNLCVHVYTTLIGDEYRVIIRWSDDYGAHWYTSHVIESYYPYPHSFCFSGDGYLYYVSYPASVKKVDLSELKANEEISATTMYTISHTGEGINYIYGRATGKNIIFWWLYYNDGYPIHSYVLLCHNGGVSWYERPCPEAVDVNIKCACTDVVNDRDYVFFEDDTGCSMVYTDDLGATWSSEVQVDAYEPAMYKRNADAHNGTVAVFTQGINGANAEVNFCLSSDEGATWDAENIITNPVALKEHMCLAGVAIYNDYIFRSYSRDDGDYPHTRFEVPFFEVSRDKGKNFSTKNWTYVIPIWFNCTGKRIFGISYEVAELTNGQCGYGDYTYDAVETIFSCDAVVDFAAIDNTYFMLTTTGKLYKSTEPLTTWTLIQDMGTEGYFLEVLEGDILLIGYDTKVDYTSDFSSFTNLITNSGADVYNSFKACNVVYILTKNGNLYYFSDIDHYETLTNTEHGMGTAQLYSGCDSCGDRYVGYGTGTVRRQEMKASSETWSAEATLEDEVVDMVSQGQQDVLAALQTVKLKRGQPKSPDSDSLMRKIAIDVTSVNDNGKLVHEYTDNTYTTQSTLCASAVSTLDSLSTAKKTVECKILGDETLNLNQHASFLDTFYTFSGTIKSLTHHISKTEGFYTIIGIGKRIKSWRDVMKEVVERYS